MKNRSLRFRLCLYFTLFITVTWMIAALFSWLECKEYIDEFFDTQQIQYAKTLTLTDLHTMQIIYTRLPGSKELLPGVNKETRGKEDDDALSFAVFTQQGKLVLASGRKGAAFIYDSTARGFSDGYIRDEKDRWRMYWLPSQDGTHVVVVGQEAEHRWDMAWDMLEQQLTPWLVLLPILILMIIILTSRELAPIKALARKLTQRKPNDVEPLDSERLPSEVRPLLASLNGLFTRTGQMIIRERAFISDAAHELRTPVAAIMVQAEVAIMSKDEPLELNNALSNIMRGADRTSRLLEQLLNLSRLETMALEKQHDDNWRLLKWPQLVEQAIAEHADELKNRQLELVNKGTSTTTMGNAVFIELLLRNLLDNAIRYSGEKGHIIITIDKPSISIANSGQVDNSCLPRLGEKFFRPPGQEQMGSGLGLSIVKRIAELHGFHVSFKNISKVDVADNEEKNYFAATISF